MKQEKNIQKFLRKFKDKYKLVFLNEESYEEVFMLRLSRLNVFTYVGTAALLIIVLVTLLIAFTPIREYIPGYPTGKERRLIIRNAQRVDSLMIEINKRDRLIKDVRTIMSGDVIEENDREQGGKLSTTADKNLSFSKSKDDSLFRSQVEEEERFNLGIVPKKSMDIQLEHNYLFSPIKGIIVNKFGDSFGHYGVDIAAAEGSRVSAVLDGTVVFAGWTVETGYVIQIQHQNNLLSFYKHNFKLLKRVGEQVKAGEAIAQVGNSGEMTTGPHLHFELWHKGAPINPEDYISFK